MRWPISTRGSEIMTSFRRNDPNQLTCSTSGYRVDFTYCLSLWKWKMWRSTVYIVCFFYDPLPLHAAVHTGRVGGGGGSQHGRDLQDRYPCKSLWLAVHRGPSQGPSGFLGYVKPVIYLSIYIYVPQQQARLFLCSYYAYNTWCVKI